MFIYLFREIEHTWALTQAEQAHREKGRKGIPSRFHTVSAQSNIGLELTNCEIMTWAKVKSKMLNWLSHPGAPGIVFIYPTKNLV